MSNQPRTEREAGFTIAELAFGLFILIIAAVVMIDHLVLSYSETNFQKDRVFAFTKAQTILAEIQAHVDGGGVSAAIELDELDDGVTNKPTTKMMPTIETAPTTTNEVQMVSR